MILKVKERENEGSHYNNNALGLYLGGTQFRFNVKIFLCLSPSQ
jgi:hypothetical protein